MIVENGHSTSFRVCDKLKVSLEGAARLVPITMKYRRLNTACGLFSEIIQG